MFCYLSIITIVTIDSDKKTELLLKYAEELGLPVKTDEHRVFTTEDIAFGFGRKATDAELKEYLMKHQNETPIDFSVAFTKYIS